MAILRNTIIVMLPLLLTGCYTDFEPKLDTEPVLCLNSLIKAGEPIKVNVSHTWVYTDVKGEKDHSVKDAEIRILANGQQVNNTYIAKEGDQIRIEANSQTYGYAEAEVTVPYALSAANIDYDIMLRSLQADITPGQGLTGRIMFDIKAEIDLPISRDKDHYYLLGYNYYIVIPRNPTYMDPDTSSPIQSFSNGHFNTSDPIFSEYVSDFENTLGYESFYDNAFFSDKRLAGASRKISFGFNDCRFSVSKWNPDSDIMGCGYKVTLNTISKSYFDWAMYFWNNENGLMGELSDIGLAEPFWGYSNVSTGAGVVAAQSSTTVTIDLKNFIQKTFLDFIQQSNSQVFHPQHNVEDGSNNHLTHTSTNDSLHHEKRAACDRSQQYCSSSLLGGADGT